MSSDFETSLDASGWSQNRNSKRLLDPAWNDTEESAKLSLFDSLVIYHDIDSRFAALNMAIDEALLEFTTEPIIRFYKWNHPALSFGYFGKFADVAHHKTERDLVRRWTGGGIVFHGNDLTYSIVIPGSDEAFSESSFRSTKRFMLRFARSCRRAEKKLSSPTPRRQRSRNPVLRMRRVRTFCGMVKRLPELHNGERAGGCCSKAVFRGSIFPQILR